MVDLLIPDPIVKLIISYLCREEEKIGFPKNGWKNFIVKFINGKNVFSDVIYVRVSGLHDD